ncbi:SDR family NAD(P)-dependent oxidoreductase [Zavarzinia sp. CC-PAN008]|uniref:SDR family NAD(P)-dependent oxidoreductase n=1 Tax=Zavarzinia sp. CC-PAN008 TaxID=3243332 RepID=UPI003F745921
MTDVQGRTAFITGGANGIGLGIARAMAKAGANVALADLDAAALDAAKAELATTTGVETFVLDVRDRDGFARAADAVEARLGPVSLLFNNAGVAGGAPVAQMGYAMWDWGIGINLGGVINGVETFVPRMVARGAGGHVVNTASGAGLVATDSGVLYTTAKFAVVGMAEALQRELQGAGIGVSVLCPGPVATNIVKRTHSLRPAREQPLSAEQTRAVEARLDATTAWLQQGVPSDRVGEMVLDAVRANRLFIHTDRIVADLLEARHQALLAAFAALD